MTTSLPKVTIQSTGAAQTAVPFTFGQVFALGHLLPADGLAAEGVPLQVDVKATHADGSVRHAVISGVLPRLAAGEVVKLQLAKTLLPKPVASDAPADLTAAVEILLDGVAYTATLAESQFELPWLEGAIVREAIVSAPLRTAAGDKHPHLAARFGVRWYPGAKRARVEFVVENNTTFTPAPRNFTYDVALLLDGKVVYEQAALTHYHHARWHHYAWRGAAPAVHVKLNTAYLLDTQAVSNYERSIVPNEALLASYAQTVGAVSGPMKIGPLLPAMPTTGGRGDIGPLPVWSVVYLLSMDKRAFDMMMAAADGSGTWSIHYRDEKTAYPVRTDNPENQYLSTHPNMAATGPLPVPRFANNDWSLVATPYAHDEAHQPSLAYLPYMVTGDYYYLEELHFWTAYNPLGTAPGYSGNGKGLLRWQQVRGQAWSMRTLGHSVYITPDAHPLKAYFAKQLEDNLEFYHQAYVVGNPNELGVYDGSGRDSYAVSASSPWQDAFFTWSFGYLAELGFEKAAGIFQWKAKYAVGRMTAPGYCWTEASAYTLKYRDSMATPIYKTFAELYQANFADGAIRDDNDRLAVHPAGLKFSDMPCGSQAQADWRAAAQGTRWPKGRMIGYADSTEGYPANMQPALALAADTTVPMAKEAWTTFAGRADVPNYSRAPQWDIVPRSIPVAPAQQSDAPVVAAPAPVPPTTMAVVAAPAGGTWQDVGVEGAKVDVPKDTIVRYGAGDKFVVAKVGGAFLASNAFFGRDPAVNVVKKVQKFIAGKPGKITTPSSTKLAKKTKLSVSVFDPKTLSLVKKFDSVTANSKGTITLSDAAISVGAQYAAVVSDAAGNVVLIQFPLTAN